MPERILIVDDEPHIRSAFSSLLRDEKLKSSAVPTAEEGLQQCRLGNADLVLLDLQLPGKSGLDFLEEVRTLPEPPVVLVVSGHADIPSALTAVRRGAVDFLEKPVPPEKLIASVRAALMLARSDRQRRTMIDNLDSSHRLIGESQSIRELLRTISQVAPTDTTVLIRGENGTGKELVATRVYLESARKDRPFIKVNCPGIPETLFESELFGHVKGSFTGAIKDFPGKFALADSGTLFLDEIGDLPLACQAKLLRTIETGEIETIGLETPRTVDVRIIAATNRNLEQLVSEGAFREDLYYRVTVFELPVPPLAKRPTDIPLLIGAFLHRYDPSGTTRLTPDAIAYLAAQQYPGNVRQLKNMIERLTIFYRQQDVNLEDILRAGLFPSVHQPTGEKPSTLTEKLEVFEREMIRAALAAHDGNISATARELSVDRANLSRKIKNLSIGE